MLRCGSAFTEVLLLGRNLDELAGYTHRLGQLFRTMDLGVKEENAKTLFATKEKLARLRALRENGGGALSDGDLNGGSSTEHSSGSDSISFHKVSVGAPEPGGGHRLLIKNVTMAVRPGNNLLITGPNGSGKTSLLRVLAGLWEPLDGTVRTPTPVSGKTQKPLMWLPQRPYLLQGSLRDQVVYPNVALAESNAKRIKRERRQNSPPVSRNGSAKRLDEKNQDDEDEIVKKCLRLAGLGKFVDGGVQGVGLNTRHLEWNDVLSGGERQRVGFARLFYHKPPFAILDEATSAINPDEEGLLYQRVLQQGTTVVSIAHRLELRKFHSLELKLLGDGKGGWALHESIGGKEWRLMDSSAEDAD